ncbi:hypothetical protein [Desulfotignum phosphitoxidans]|uniref:Uncharacterized protein n=1 Tax=Desulfotignum phosphitoxidans DSM 13687 TaxID=1286635 RepID=S0FVX1_9BACT|nr:hypothetical protein [Desulfotignum phosphitoxidans]EMS79193.1 hypothetical protein Dpo_5c01160 [Desulfotignum phosphitoxidans DSM 13687]
MTTLWHGISEIEANSQINRLSESIERIEDLIKEGANVLKENPEDIALELSIRSLKAKHSQLHTNMAEIMRHRVAESIELSLKGEKYSNHTADLLSISQILNIFQRLISSIAQTITKGPTERGRIGEELEYLSRLRLVRTYSSSFGVEIQIDTNSDMFGDSIALTTLKTFFSLLNSFDSKQGILNRSGSLSGRSIAHFRRFFKSLVLQKAAPKLSWVQPNGSAKCWEASLDRLAIAASNIEGIQKETSEDVEVEGFLAGASLLRSKFDFISTDNRIYSGRVSNQTKNLLENYFAKQCKATIEIAINTDKVTNEEKQSFVLKNISDIN